MKSSFLKLLDKLVGLVFYFLLFFVSCTTLGVPLSEIKKYIFEKDIKSAAAVFIFVMIPFFAGCTVAGIATLILTKKSMVTKRKIHAEGYIKKPDIIKKEDINIGPANGTLSTDEKACYMLMGMIYIKDDNGQDIGTMYGLNEFSESVNKALK
ncbi:MAG: hypothetical protein Q4D76_15205 [Oscillospiraceae bacterium]|nr:hypothetical protein [Oscillospiraceae bacterium]